MHTISSCGKSDIGLSRPNNEDFFSERPDLGLFLVSDGIGGAAAGELASRFLGESSVEVFSATKERSAEATIALVQQAFWRANKRIRDHISKYPLHAGMGCTADLLAMAGDSFIIGHVGDSRVYRFRKGQLKQLTRDHTLVQSLIDQGLISPEEARISPYRHIILLAVGIDKVAHFDLVMGKMSVGDIFLLCTDGLTDMVTDQAIENVLASNATLPQKVDKLIKLAKTAGGFDNITVILLQIFEANP